MDTPRFKMYINKAGNDNEIITYNETSINWYLLAFPLGHLLNEWKSKFGIIGKVKLTSDSVPGVECEEITSANYEMIARRLFRLDIPFYITLHEVKIAENITKASSSRSPSVNTAGSTQFDGLSDVTVRAQLLGSTQPPIIRTVPANISYCEFIVEMMHALNMVGEVKASTLYRSPPKRARKKKSSGVQQGITAKNLAGILQSYSEKCVPLEVFVAGAVTAGVTTIRSGINEQTSQAIMSDMQNLTSIVTSLVEEVRMVKSMVEAQGIARSASAMASISPSSAEAAERNHQPGEDSDASDWSEVDCPSD